MVNYKKNWATGLVEGSYKVMMKVNPAKKKK
jgi:hypothetical protein